MVDFFFTDKILQKLNEDLFQRSSMEFDAGLDKSVLNKTWGTGSSIGAFIAKLLGPGGTPEKLVIKLSDEMKSEQDTKYLSNLLFNNIKTVPVFLPHILVTNKIQRQETTQEESFSFSNYRYECLNEASLHKIGKNFFQSMDSSHRVFFSYKGQLATVEPNKTFNSFIQNSMGTVGHGPIHNYVVSNLDKVTNLVKNDVLSILDNDIDKAVVTNILSSGQVPVVLQNAMAAGILDVANIGIQTSPKAFTPTSSSVADICLGNKDSIIISQNQVHTSGYAIIPDDIKNNLKNKIISSQHLASDVYKKDGSLQLFLDSYELGKKNPHSTYRKVYKMNLTVFNWIVNDLNKTVFKSQTKKSDLYFSSPTQEEITKNLGSSPKKDSMPFVVIKAVGSDESEFPAEFRCFATENSKSKDASYSGIAGVTKVCVITPGFNSYITNKAQEEFGNTDIQSYIAQLNSIQPGESSAHMSFTEGAKVMWTALKNCYTGNGKFETKILFKYIPELLSQDERFGLSIRTSLKDLSSMSLPFSDKLSRQDSQFLVDKVAKHASLLLVNPIDSNTGTVSGMIHPVDLYSNQVNMIQERFIANNDFISLSTIKQIFLDKLDEVSSLNDLLEVSSMFSPVLRNLSRGFWTATGGFSISENFNDGKSLGLYNILKADSFSSEEKTMDLGVIGGSLNLRSLGLVSSKDPNTGSISIHDTGDAKLFTNARIQATDDAVKSVATFIGGR